MEIYQTTVGDSLELELFDGNDVALDLSLYNEDESFLRLVYPSATIDKAIRFGIGNIVYYDVVEGDFDENENVQAQLFLLKLVNDDVLKRKPLEIFTIQVLPVLPAPEVVP